MDSRAGAFGGDRAAPLLKTKLESPEHPPLVLREDLLEAVTQGVAGPLTLIYGPAGSGKTMLAAQWRAMSSGPPAVWLALEPDDNDPVRFWTYLIEAIGSALPHGFGEGALAMLRAPGAATIAPAVASIVNELAGLTDPVVVVFDDYHAIDDARIHAGMATLIERAPRALRVVISSRVEPPLGVASLRARGRLTEIDAARLRFSRAEAAALLNEVHGLGVDDEIVARLHERTEGWAAGLYLAVLSLRGRADVEAFVSSFAGSDRRVVDFLSDEVLAGRPEDELRFLLWTSVLDRFCAPLCDAVLGVEGSRAMLDRLERTNYFLIPLDPSHDWYRYHHLFAELLRHELRRREPASVPELHARAGRWLLGADLIAEAIGQLTAAGELGEVADLITTHWLAFANAGERATVSRWLDALPRGHVLGDGRLCLTAARNAALAGAGEEVLAWLELAERAPAHNPKDDPWLAEQAKVFRSTAWQQLGDMRLSGELAADLGPLDGSSFWHALAADNLGTVAYWSEDNPRAAALLESALALNRDEIAMVSVNALGLLACVAAEGADWRGCAARLEAASDLVATHGLEEYPQSSLVHLARARLLRHQRRPVEARGELERSLGLARRGIGRVESAYVLVALADLLLETGDRRSARESVLEARDLLAACPEPGTRVPRLLAEVEARLRLVVRDAGPRRVVTDALTAREQAVLTLLPGGLSAREIGAELGISRDTVKTHTKSIYRKLGVSDRRDAVRLARELDLL
jgi:LuxR family maltose regulon positive regulatory protein